MKTIGYFDFENEAWLAELGFGSYDSEFSWDTARMHPIEPHDDALD